MNIQIACNQNCIEPKNVILCNEQWMKLYGCLFKHERAIAYRRVGEMMMLLHDGDSYIDEDLTCPIFFNNIDIKFVGDLPFQYYKLMDDHNDHAWSKFDKSIVDLKWAFVNQFEREEKQKTNGLYLALHYTE